MSPFRKNLMVGGTAIGGIFLLGVLMLKFGVIPAQWVGPRRIHVHLHASRADGVSPGASVTYLGVSVGNIGTVSRSADQKEVVIDALLEAANPPPDNVIGRIRTQLVGGGAILSLEVPAGQAPTGHLAAGAAVPTEFVGSDLLPREFSDLATELRLTTEQIRKSDLAVNLNKTVLTFREQAEKAGKLIDSLDSAVNDPKMREDLKSALAGIRAATDTANRVAANVEKFTVNLNTVTENANTTLTKAQGHVDDVSKQLNDRMLQVAKLLEQFQSIAAKVDDGKGTAGKLINDAKLYESLVDTSRELNLTIKELNLLVKQWTDEGVYIKLNK